MPTKVPVYFTGKDGYETKAAVEWEEVPAEESAKAGQFTVRAVSLVSLVGVLCMITDKLVEALSENPNYDENS